MTDIYYILGCFNPNANVTNSSTFTQNELENVINSDTDTCDWGYNGEEILKFFGFENETNVILRDFGILFFCILLCRTIALIALFIRARLVR